MIVAESFLVQTETTNPPDSHADPSPGSAVFQKRIEFHPAKKTFKGFTNGTVDFQLNTLNTACYSDPRRPAVGGKKQDGYEFSEHGLDPELSFGITF